MSKKEVSIDFRKSQNRIILLVGKNGSGKTSLLSNMHPFPYVESIDVRNTQDLILDGKEGLKYLELKHGKNKYEITINYLLQRDKRVTRCYIKKNGVELNPSGLVRVYYDILKLEFNIEPSFLRIIRLGPNVADIISMRSTDRKDFISTFLSDIDIYAKLFGVIKEESNFVKNQLKMLTASYDKIENMEILKADFITAKEEIRKANERLTELNNQLTLAKDRLARETLSESAITDIMDRWSKESEFIATYQKHADKTDSILEDYGRLMKLKISAEADLKTVEDRINDLSNILSKSLDKLADYENKLALITTSDGAEDFDRLIDEYKSKIRELGKVVEPLGSLEQFGIIRRLWKECVDMIQEISDIVIFGIYRDECQYQSEDTILDSLSDAIDNKLSNLSEKIALAKADRDIKYDITKGRIMYVPSECKISHVCPYYKAIANYHGNKSTDSLKKLNAWFDYYMLAKNNLATLRMIQKNIGMINDFHTSIQLSFGEIFVQLINYKQDDLYKIDDQIEHVLSQARDYDVHESLVAKIDDLRTRKALYDKTGGIKFINDAIAELNTEIGEHKSELGEFTESKKQIKADLADITRQFEEVGKLCDVINHYTVNRDYYAKLISDHELALKSDKIRDEIDHDIWVIDTNIQSANIWLRDATNKANDLYYKIKSKSDLETQLSDVKSRFEYVEIIREALSSTKGIPLVFIQLYLKNIQILANKIIHEMFSDDISLLDFVITDKEFSIPYIVNGIEIKDVSYSSQGERTTIVMALSFALLQQFIGKYNILLLDEVDSALYKDNRRKFIKIIEDQMGSIGCEQAFMITHNALFENYPVDIILTSEVDQNDYNRGNIIWSV